MNAALPGFQENLQRSADILRQSGPRFASNTERVVGEQSRGAVQDFNLFQQQVFEAGRNRQLQTLLGAGQFSLGQSGQDLSALLPLLQTALQAGGAGSAPVITENPGFLQGTLLPLLGVGGSLAATAFPSRPPGTVVNVAAPVATGNTPQTPQQPGG